MQRIIMIIGLLAIAAVGTAQVEEVWARRYCPDEDFWHYPSGLAVDDHGNVYVTGRSQIDRYDYATIKYSPDGTELWVRRYDAGSVDEAVAIGLDAAGNVYVTGFSWSSYQDYVTIKYAPDGRELWVARWGYTRPDGRRDLARPAAMVVDAAGNSYITGLAGHGGYGRYATVKYDPDGRLLWVAILGEYRGESSPLATDIALDGDGNVFVTGRGALSPSTPASVTVKYNSAGVLQWTAEYPNRYAVDAPRIATDRDGNAYVTTFNVRDDGKDRYTTIKYSPTGTQLWLRYWQDPEENICRPYAIAVDQSGNAYVFGQAHTRGGSLYATVKYGPDGTELWAVIEENPTGGWLARCIALDHEGNVYVTGHGTSERADSSGFSTIKYAPNGDKLWAAHSHQAYSSYGSLPAGLAVDQAGHVYVTGYWYRTGALWYDYKTIKYRQGTGIAESGTPAAPPQVSIGPNPLTGGFAALRYNLPQAGPVRVRVFDVTGRSVFSTRSPGHLATGSLPLDLRALNAGVYLVKLEADGFATTQKLIIQR